MVTITLSTLSWTLIVLLVLFTVLVIAAASRKGWTPKSKVESIYQDEFKKKLEQTRDHTVSADESEEAQEVYRDTESLKDAVKD